MPHKNYLFSLCFLLFIQSTLLSQITPIQNGNWDDPQIWPAATLPTIIDYVQIPAGMEITMAGNMEAYAIDVGGTLKAINQTGSPSNITVETRAIHVLNGGVLEIGTATTPYTGNCVITLVGNDPTEFISSSMGTKFIGAMSGGYISIHGSITKSWSQLGASVSAGSNTITLKELVNWQVGQEIVIVSSRKDWTELEKRTITNISTNGTTFTLDTPLNFPHSGVVKTYTNGTQTWVADLRAEVGLLNRNIKIQGDLDTELNGFGGHIMIHNNAEAYISHVHLYRMGQKAIMGRYPMHWHMLGSSGAGQYFKNSSIQRSFNRAITIHGTESVTVENNFCVNHVGHGIFLEDGSERYNTIKGNVVLLSTRPAPGEELTPSDNEFNQMQNRTPSSYWITNPTNTFIDNVAAGTEGTGFWYALAKAPMGVSATDPRFAGMEPYKLPMGQFKGNKAHSCMSGFDIFDALNSDHSIHKNFGWHHNSDKIIEDCTWYANELAVYSGIGPPYFYASKLFFENNIFVENKLHTMLASYSTIQNSVFVAKSGENLMPGENHLWRLYDGAGRLYNSHLEGWDAPDANLLINNGAGVKHANHLFSGISFNHTGTVRLSLPNYVLPFATNIAHNAPEHPRVWTMSVKDLDGTITGHPNSTIISNHPFLRLGDECQPDNWTNAYYTNRSYVLARVHMDLPVNTTTFPNVLITRSKANTPTINVYYIDGYSDNPQIHFIVNEGFEYTYQFETLPSTKVIRLDMDDATIGDEYIVKFKDFGLLGGLNITATSQGISQKNSLSDLYSSATTAYYIDVDNTLYVKQIATQMKQTVNISWTTDFVPPSFNPNPGSDAITDFSSCGPPLLNITDLTATELACDQVQLNWSDINAEDGYTIKRSEGENNFWTYVAVLPANTTTWVDNLTPSLQSRIFSYQICPTLNGQNSTSNVGGVIVNACPLFEISVRAFFKGFIQSNAENHTQLNNLNLIPTSQPFNTAPWNYNGNEQIAGGIDPSISDWVLLRLFDQNYNVLDEKAALIRNDGAIVDVNNQSNISFNLFENQVNYLSLHHKSHLAIIAPVSGNGLIDFSISGTAMGNNQTENIFGVECMVVGDFDGNGIINNLDYNLWTQNSSAVNSYLSWDADGNGIVNNLDFNLWNIHKSKVGQQQIHY